MQPIHLDGAAAWFHQAKGGRGVVILGAFGYEDLCSRATLLALADGLAAAGLPTLRLDRRGTGDSADLPLGADRLAAWIADVHAAVDWLRRATGVSEVAVVGLRLGALIATAAALAGDGIDRLVLLAPPTSGRSHRRELTILARLIADGRAAPSPDGAVEVAGFRLEPEVAAALDGIDLEALPRRPASEILLVGETTSPGFLRLATGLAFEGPAPDVLGFDGYARMMCDPTASEPATAMVERVIGRLAADQPEGHSHVPDLPPARLVTADWQEEAMVFGGGLVGVLCAPRGAIDPGRCAVWLNSGRNHHIGWARQTVDLSRRLARAGVAVLRIDLAGIGDSPARPATPVSALYHDDGRADVVAAIDELARRGWHHPTIIGGCSGAYQAFHAAAGEPRIAGVVLINQLCFLWDDSYAAHLSAWMTNRPGQFEAEVRRAESESDGRTALRTIRAALGDIKRRALRGFGGLRRVLRLEAAAGPGVIERRFRDYAARGLKVSIVLSEGDKAVDELALHTGSRGCRIAGLPGVSLLWLRDADHSLSSQAARDALGDHLVAILAREGAEAAGRADGGADLERAVERALREPEAR